MKDGWRFQHEESTAECQGNMPGLPPILGCNEKTDNEIVHRGTAFQAVRFSIPQARCLCHNQMNSLNPGKTDSTQACREKPSSSRGATRSSLILGLPRKDRQ